MKSMSNNLKLRLGSSFLNRIASFAIAPFMTLYFAVTVSVKVASILAMVQIVVAYTSNFVGGYVGDQYNEKKVLFYGQTIHGIIQLFMAFAMYQHFSWILVVITYMISVFIGNLYKSTLSSLLVASVNEDNRKFAFTLDYLSVNIALAFGMILGSLTFNGLQYIVFIFSGIVILLIGVVLNKWYVVEKSEINKIISHEGLRVQFKNLFTGYKYPLKDKAFRGIVLGVSLVSSVQMALQNGISVNLKEHFRTTLIFGNIHLNGIKMFSWLQIENVALIIILTMIVFKFLSVKNSYVNVLYGGIVFILIYSLMFLSLNWVVLFILGLIGTICETLIMPEFQSVQSKLIPLDRKSTYVSFNQLGNYLSQLIAAIGLYVYAEAGVSLAAIFTLIFGVIGVWLVVPIVKNAE
ncbi:MFS transporter [Weissella paramesenteroides]|uniref:MFS transporter n=1 Tax=Weissella paramesenteroides TaxID=1249 RepID=UPI0018DAB70A|nr:MFS transporter [Weissella paramesenteroides]QPI45383.1 MFS transporter [Weissella paramesenteroides]QPI45393.1 MFS transporter [Weissella paramesenteroides]